MDRLILTAAAATFALAAWIYPGALGRALAVLALVLCAAALLVGPDHPE